MFLRPEDAARKKMLAEQNALVMTLRSEDACMHATHAFVYYDQHNHKDCLVYLKRAIECDKRSSTAHRLWGESRCSVLHKTFADVTCSVFRF